MFRASRAFLLNRERAGDAFGSPCPLEICAATRWPSESHERRAVVSYNDIPVSLVCVSSAGIAATSGLIWFLTQLVPPVVKT